MDDDDYDDQDDFEDQEDFNDQEEEQDPQEDENDDDIYLDDNNLITFSSGNHIKRGSYTKLIVVPSEKRITSNILTNYELSMIIGIRVTHLEQGAAPFIDLPDSKNISLKMIAITEIIDKKCPFTIRRQLPNGDVEQWSVNEMCPNLNFMRNYYTDTL